MAIKEVEVAELVSVLRHVHGLDARQDHAVRARLKHLQRLGFPKGRPQGRGVRTTYDLDEVIKIAAVFELVAVGLSSTLAVDAVRRGWDDIGDLVAEALGGARQVRLIEIRPREMRGVGQLAVVATRAPSNLPTVTRVASSSYRPLRDDEAGAAAVILDPGSLARRLLAALRSPGLALPIAGDENLRAWRPKLGN